jgi:hypothetical protein
VAFIWSTPAVITVVVVIVVIIIVVVVAVRDLVTALAAAPEALWVAGTCSHASRWKRALLAFSARGTPAKHAATTAENASRLRLGLRTCRCSHAMRGLYLWRPSTIATAC